MNTPHLRGLRLLVLAEYGEVADIDFVHVRSVYDARYEVLLQELHVPPHVDVPFPLDGKDERNDPARKGVHEEPAQIVRAQRAL